MNVAYHFDSYCEVAVPFGNEEPVAVMEAAFFFRAVLPAGLVYRLGELLPVDRLQKITCTVISEYLYGIFAEAGGKDDRTFRRGVIEGLENKSVSEPYAAMIKS